MKRFLIVLLTVVLLVASVQISPVSADSTCGTTYTVQRGDYLSKIAKLCGTTTAAMLDANPSITNWNLIYPGQVLKIPSSTTPAPGIGGSVYIAKPGDTLNSIAALFKVSLQDLLKVNPSIADPNRIETGQKITLPTGAASVRTAGVSPVAGKAGDLVTLAVTGFKANAYLEIRFGLNENETEVVGNLQTDARGAILQTVGIPSSAKEGKSYIFLVRVRTSSAEKAVSNSFLIGQSSGGNPSVYTVVRGDTLRKIADRFGTTVAAILAANPSISNPNVIYVGQRVTIPASGKGPAVTVLPLEAAPGAKVKVVADGFPANQPVDIRLGVEGKEVVLVVDAKTDTSGYLNQEVTVPASAKSGEKWVVRILTTEIAKTVEASGTLRIK